MSVIGYVKTAAKKNGGINDNITSFEMEIE